MLWGEDLPRRLSRSRSAALTLALLTSACGESKSDTTSGVSSGGTNSGVGGSAGFRNGAEGGRSVSHGASGASAGDGGGAGGVAGTSLTSGGGASTAGGAAGAPIAANAGAATAPLAGASGVGGSADDVHFRMPYAKSGSRLRAMGYAADGAEQFLYLEDSRFEDRCVFVESADGKGLICVPYAQANLVVYADDQCTQPVIGIDASQTGATSVSVIEQRWTQCPGSFPPHRSTYRIGELIPPDVTRFDGAAPTFVSDESGCKPWGWKGSPPELHHVSLVADSELVSAQPQTVTLGSELALTRVIADDGSELTYSVATSAGTACALQEDGQCVPQPLATESSNFVDDQCTRTALYSPYYYLDGCGEPNYAVTKGADGVHVFDLTLVSSLFRVTAYAMMLKPSECGHSPDNGKFYDRANDVTNTFKKYDRVRVGAGRLRAELIAWRNPNAPDEAPVPLGVGQGANLFRATDGRPCLVMAASDGSLRCAPLLPGAFSNSLYADDACTQAVYTSVLDAANPALSPMAADNDASGQLQAVFPLKEYSGTTYANFGSGCGSVTPPTQPGQTYRYWVADGRIDIADLPAVELKAL
jgi:hypothetical protein